MFANVIPRVGLRRKASSQFSNMRQDRLAPLLDRQPTQPGCVNSRGTQQLSRKAKPIQIVRKFPKTQRHADLFV